MPDQSTSDFTQTVIGAITPAVTSSSHPSLFESLEARFRIIALLGKRGMGEVYRATDFTLGQSVALKFLPQLASSDPRWLERFHSRVRICAGLAAVASELNASEIRQGTPANISPEQLKGIEATQLSDTHSLRLGLTAFTAAAYWLSMGGQSIFGNDPK